MSEIILRANKELKAAVEKNNARRLKIEKHLTEMLKWADYLLERYPKANREVVEIAIYLHDIGHFLPGDEDHAILSEKFAYSFLHKNNYDKKDEVLHCIRAHRNKDVSPITLEAKIIATIDSLSHISAGVYLDMIKEGLALEKVIGKIKRDYRDLQFFPDIQKEMTDTCLNWEKSVIEYEKML